MNPKLQCMSTPSASTPRTPTRVSAHGKALALGLLGVGLFALSLPMTRLAVGSTQSPQLSPEFVALGLVLSSLFAVLFQPAEAKPAKAADRMPAVPDPDP